MDLKPKNTPKTRGLILLRCKHCGANLVGSEYYCGTCGFPVGQSDEESSKRRFRKIAITSVISVVCVVAAIVSAICVSLSGDTGMGWDTPMFASNNDSDVDDTKSNDTIKNENSTNQSLPPGDISDLASVEINGISYSFPSEPSVFRGNGWDTEHSIASSEPLVEAESYETPRFYTESGQGISLYVINTDEGNDLAIDECTVIGVGFPLPSVGVNFKLNSGLTYGSTYDEFKSFYGEPSKYEENNNGSANGFSNLGVIHAYWEFKFGEERVCYTGEFYEPEPNSGDYELAFFTIVYEPEGWRL